MAERIPQSVTIRVLLKAYLASDHVSPATGKTIAVVISKNGAAFGNPSGGATNATQIGNGWYYVDLSITDTGTQGPLVVRGTEGTIDDSEVAYNVVDANSGGAAYLDAAVSSRSTYAGGAVASVTGNVGGNVVGSVASVTGNVGGNVVGSVASVTAGCTLTAGERTSVGTAVWASATRTLTSFGTLASDVWAVAVRTITGGSLTIAPPTAAQISTQVWSEPIPGAFGAGTAGKKLDSASAAGDPWSTALPGAYGAGTAGNIVGNRLDAAVSGVPAAVLDAPNGVETGWTLRQWARIVAGVLFGKADGGGTATMHFRNPADTKNRVTATVDANGNRTAVTTDPS